MDDVYFHIIGDVVVSQKRVWRSVKTYNLYTLLWKGLRIRLNKSNVKSRYLRTKNGTLLPCTSKMFMDILQKDYNLELDMTKLYFRFVDSKCIYGPISKEDAIVMRLSQ